MALLGQSVTHPLPLILVLSSLLFEVLTPLVLHPQIVLHSMQIMFESYLFTLLADKIYLFFASLIII